MPRANRHFIPDQIWHITHRCHKREFLLKFAKDRQRWLGWLFDARKRFGLSIDEGLAKGNPFRDDRWTESLAVGGAAFHNKALAACFAAALARLRKAEIYAGDTDFRAIVAGQKIGWL